MQFVAIERACTDDYDGDHEIVFRGEVPSIARDDDNDEQMNMDMNINQNCITYLQGCNNSSQTIVFSTVIILDSKHMVILSDQGNKSLKSTRLFTYIYVARFANKPDKKQY